MTTSPSPSPAILEVTGLHFGYPERTLFSDWSTRMPAGVTLVLGGDGRGKTTLLRLLAGELAADAGEFCIHGMKLRTQPTPYLQQTFWTEPRTTAFDQMTPVDFFQLQRSKYAGFDEGLLARCVDGLALAPELPKQMFMLSTGSKRKVYLAAAFASGAAVTLLDMPFAALDKASVACVLSLLAEAATHPSRVFVAADYAAPAGVPLTGTLNLGD